jgi:hypothetical protein
MDGFVQAIKQYPGQQQVDRSVKVKVPGKHFPQLQASEQAAMYWGTAVEFRDRQKFPRHAKAWGGEHTGPGIRFICDSDAIDDPDNKGFWTTLTLWNRWRHETFKDDRDAETQYLDELPDAKAAAADKGGGAKQEKAEPAIKKYFDVVSTGTHTFGGKGKMAGTTAPFFMYACKKLGCKRGLAWPIKQVAKATGQLFSHLAECQPQLCLKLRGDSSHSRVQYDETTGESYELYPFEEQLPHHALFVVKCFRGFDHFYESRADTGLLEWVRSYDKRASLPHLATCQKLLQVFEELVDEKLLIIIARHKSAFGTPCCGETCDIWSLSSCRESFGCLRGSFVLDGEMLVQITGDDSYKGKLVDVSPILAFARFDETRHTGAAIARWKKAANARWQLQDAVGLATEDGASNNKRANQILGQEYLVCWPHDIARAVLAATGMSGKTSKNPQCKALIGRTSKQSSCFHRSVVANKDLQEAQLDAGAKPHQVKTTKVKNETRWLGLWEMCHRNRQIGPEIRIALTGDESGVCAEEPAAAAVRPVPSLYSDDDQSESGEESEGDDLEEGARAAGKEFPLAHRCLSMGEFRQNEVLESLLDRARELTLLVQDQTPGWGEGLDLGLSWLFVKVRLAAPLRPTFPVLTSALPRSRCATRTRPTACRS